MVICKENMLLGERAAKKRMKERRQTAAA